MIDKDLDENEKEQILLYSEKQIWIVSVANQEAFSKKIEFEIEQGSFRIIKDVQIFKNKNLLVYIQSTQRDENNLVSNTLHLFSFI